MKIHDMRFGVLGDAKIAREKLLPAIRAAGREVTHVARRDLGAAGSMKSGVTCISAITRR